MIIEVEREEPSTPDEVAAWNEKWEKRQRFLIEARILMGNTRMQIMRLARLLDIDERDARVTWYHRLYSELDQIELPIR